MRRALLAYVLAAGAILAGVLSLGAGGEDPYVIKLRLDNAGGLKNGSDVAIGGVRVGSVDLEFDEADRVVAELRIDRRYAPVSKDTRAAISAINLLGAKRVDLISGPAAESPAPDGFEIPAKRVTESTDLDQVLSVLEPDTRTRLAVLISEAGLGFKGRRADLNEVLQTLPPSLKDFTVIADELVRDNTTLANLLTHSDRLVHELAKKRGDLQRVVGAGAEAVHSIGTRDRQLRATLATAPRTLQTLQRFLGELERTTKPLAPAARDIRQAAPQVVSVLDQLEPFRKAARPTLATATDVAPRLTRLANGATPVLRRAVPTIASLARAGTALAPVSHTLDRSADNLIAILHNWSRAIQFRDGASHVFRGQPSFTTDTLDSVIRGLLPESKKHRKRSRAKREAAPRPDQRDVRPAPAPSAKRPLDAVRGGVDRLEGTLKELLGKGRAPLPPSPRDEATNTTQLLDFLFRP